MLEGYLSRGALGGAGLGDVLDDPTLIQTAGSQGQTGSLLVYLLDWAQLAIVGVPVSRVIGGWLEGKETGVREALWFLARAAEFRPEFGAQALDMARDRLPKLIAMEDEAVRLAVADFLGAVDPDPERIPPENLAGQELTDWLEQVLYALFPPIRRISEGLFELWPGEDRDLLAEVVSDITLAGGSAPAGGSAMIGLKP